MPKDEIVTCRVGETDTPVGISVRTSDTGHDVWYPRALGKSAHPCWAALGAGDGQTVAELAARTGRTPPTIRRVLAHLAEHGVARTEEER